MSISNQLWPLVIVGKGTSAAFYVCTVDLDQYRSVLAIGDDDAWSADKRGHHGASDDPTRRLNHPLHLVQHFKKTVPGFSEVMVDRLDWANMNAQTLAECNVETYQGKVSKVSACTIPESLAPERGTPISGYKIEIPKHDPVYALKVVMAAGAGEHRTPAEFTDVQKRYPTQVMNMDVFAKLGPDKLNSKTKVVIFGPNAAIDCIQKGAFYNCQMTWMINTTPDKLPILATQPKVTEWVKNNAANIFTYESFNFPVSQIGLRVQATSKSGVGKNVAADYVVFGLGQTGDPVKNIDVAIQGKLVPIYDVNNALGGGSSTILGYQSEGTSMQAGFEVIGALSAQIGRAIQSERVKKLKEQIDALRNVEKMVLAISTAKFPVAKPFLLKDPDFLSTQPLEPFKAQLQREAAWVVKQNSTLPGIAEAVQNLVGLLNGYYAAKNYAKLINLAASHLPKGTVADGGQITTIKSAMAAKHATQPKYLPGQQFTTTGPTSSRVKGEEHWIDVKTSPGDVNWHTDNATMLQIGLCQMYPLIPDDKLNTWIDNLMIKRRNSNVGFKPAEIEQFHVELRGLNLAGAQAMNKMK